MNTTNTTPTQSMETAAPLGIEFGPDEKHERTETR
jgi:hypothetical protein